ncbi:MAG: hypothetical protein ACPG5B_04410 [Chitinophagales bacterium]
MDISIFLYPTKIIPITISIVSIIILILKRKKITPNTYQSNIWVSALVFFILYFLIIFISTSQGIYYWSVYHSFDVNQNGFIDVIEKTAAFYEIEKKVLHDTARNFAFITGAILAFIVAVFVLLVGFIKTFFLAKMKKKKQHTFN